MALTRHLIGSCAHEKVRRANVQSDVPVEVVVDARVQNGHLPLIAGCATEFLERGEAFIFRSVTRLLRGAARRTGEAEARDGKRCRHKSVRICEIDGSHESSSKMKLACSNQAGDWL